MRPKFPSRHSSNQRYSVCVPICFSAPLIWPIVYFCLLTKSTLKCLIQSRLSFVTIKLQNQGRTRLIRLRVKEIAEARGYNMSTLSRASDVSFKTIKRIFRNPYTGVTVDTLNRLANALKVSITDLMVEEPDEHP